MFVIHVTFGSPGCNIKILYYLFSATRETKSLVCISQEIVACPVDTTDFHFLTRVDENNCETTMQDETDLT